MDNNYFYNIIFLAFENLIKCEDKYEVSIESFSKYRKEIVKRVKNNFDFLTANRSDAVRDNLLSFIDYNEKMTKEDENLIISLFVLKYTKLFDLKDNIIYLKDKVPYEDIAEVRYMPQSTSIRDTLTAIYTEGNSFEALSALGCTKVMDDVKKIINVEYCIEDSFLYPLNISNSLINVGNFYVKGRFLEIANMPFHRLNEYFMNFSEYARRDNYNERITDLLLSEDTRNNKLFLDYPFIDDELCNIFQHAIFCDDKLHHGVLLDYFDTVWDYVYKDDIDAGINCNLDDYLDDDCDCFVKDDDNDIDDVSMYFYLNYINMLNHHSIDNTEVIKKRILYSLNHLNSNISNKKYLSEMLSTLEQDSDAYTLDDYSDFYIISSLFVLDILNGNIDDLTLRKVVFVANYYNLTLDNRIIEMIDLNNKFGKIIYNVLINDKYDDLKREVLNIKNKSKEKI